ncbi:hypothetical protein [Blastococcus brunescens]|uniref:DivIVA protein n=1 Tax=Blastococcus brunescens TaxID=1564165 RepID=A0ABZ1B765_9ACTN|nr:hypothetical protein [Blastococcus sp. BMG 8361]WRL66584.1 hypothetical protein U6N30_14985 [Blastococcus sp. BMG 8361]
MSVELHAEDGAAVPAREPVQETGPRDRARPHVSGDLPTVLGTGPMFRRTVAGYDRFQVDTYVQWAEDELATADREREHLLAGHVRTRAELDQARALLSHSAAGGQLLTVSRRIGSMLAAAADEAQTIVAEAENHRSVASARAEVLAADAHRVLADAEQEAARRLHQATAEVAAMAAEAARLVADAERTGLDARAEAAARLATVRQVERRAAEGAEEIRRSAVADAEAARLVAREEVVGMLGVGREQRRRADVEAAAVRDRLDRDAAARRAVLLAEVADLEHRRDALRAELDRAARAAAAPPGSRPAGVRSPRVARRAHRPAHGGLGASRWPGRACGGPSPEAHGGLTAQGARSADRKTLPGHRVSSALSV